MIALSRLMLPNVINIQASWLTVGEKTAQICLHAGANDFGSIMIEENVVSAAGAPHRFTAEGIQRAIREAGFEPALRNQQYEYRDLPEIIEQQVINY
jgi:cyclic dehypoxanthinyl futalosine synthase